MLWSSAHTRLAILVAPLAYHRTAAFFLSISFDPGRTFVTREERSSTSMPVVKVLRILLECGILPWVLPPSEESLGLEGLWGPGAMGVMMAWGVVLTSSSSRDCFSWAATRWIPASVSSADFRFLVHLVFFHGGGVLGRWSSPTSSTLMSTAPGCATEFWDLVDIQHGMEGWGIALEKQECTIVEEEDVFRYVRCSSKWHIQVERRDLGKMWQIFIKSNISMPCCLPMAKSKNLCIHNVFSLGPQPTIPCLYPNCSHFFYSLGGHKNHIRVNHLSSPSPPSTSPPISPSPPPVPPSPPHIPPSPPHIPPSLPSTSPPAIPNSQTPSSPSALNIPLSPSVYKPASLISHSEHTFENRSHFFI